MISKETLLIRDKFKQKIDKINSGKTTAAEKIAFECKYEEFRLSHNKLVSILMFNNLSSIGLGFVLLIYISFPVFSDFLANHVNITFFNNHYIDYFVTPFLFLTYLSIVIIILYARKFFGIGLIYNNGKNGLSFKDPLDGTVIKP